MPKVIWNKEKCKNEALKYESRSEFMNGSPSSYCRCLKMKWIDEVCLHMIQKGNMYKRCIYICKFSDNSIYIGLTCNFEKRKNDHSVDKKSTVYKYSIKTNQKPEIIKLTDYVDIKKAKILEEYYLQFYKINYNILNKRKTGGLGSMMIWTKEKCKEEALKYKTKNEFKKNARSAYGSSRNNGWFDEICSHMNPVYQKWTKEKCKEEISKYITLNDFYKNSLAVGIIRYNKWYELLKPLKYTTRPNKYWTKEKCKEEALKYKTKKEFQKNNGSAYNSVYKNKWENELCSHMIMRIEKKWFVYIVECSDENKTLYTGITTDIDHRIKTHNKGKGSKLLRGNKIPVNLKYLKECKNKSEAGKEEYRIKQLTRNQKEELYTNHIIF